MLQRLYGRVVIASAVASELRAGKAPLAVKQWVANLPPWIEVCLADSRHLVVNPDLDAGELEAISIALSEKGSVLIIDELLGREVATSLGVQVTGTLGVLVEAAAANYVDLESALNDLTSTNFHISQALIRKLLKPLR